jgi:hypothetical protein
MEEITLWGQVCWESRRREFALKALAEAEALRLAAQGEKVETCLRWRSEGDESSEECEVTGIWITSSGFELRSYSSNLDWTPGYEKEALSCSSIELDAELIEEYTIGLDDVRYILKGIESMRLLREILQMLQRDTLLRKLVIGEDTRARTVVSLVPEGLHFYCGDAGCREEFTIMKYEPQRITYELVNEWPIKLSGVQAVMDLLRA